MRQHVVLPKLDGLAAPLVLSELSNFAAGCSPAVVLRVGRNLSFVRALRPLRRLAALPRFCGLAAPSFCQSPAAFATILSGPLSVCLWNNRGYNAPKVARIRPVRSRLPSARRFNGGAAEREPSLPARVRRFTVRPPNPLGASPTEKLRRAAPFLILYISNFFAYMQTVFPRNSLSAKKTFCISMVNFFALDAVFPRARRVYPEADAFCPVCLLRLRMPAARPLPRIAVSPKFIALVGSLRFVGDAGFAAGCPLPKLDSLVGNLVSSKPCSLCGEKPPRRGLTLWSAPSFFRSGAGFAAKCLLAEA